MKRLFTKLAAIGSSIALLPFIAHAQFGGALKNVKDVAGAGGAGYATTDGSNQLLKTIGTLVGAVLGMLGIVFVLYMIYAGFLWMTAGGDSEKVTKSKLIIKNCIIGLIIVTLSYAITSFVFNKMMCASDPGSCVGVTTSVPVP